MTDKLPPNLLALFQPRPPVKYIPPQDDAPQERASKPSQIGGLGALLGQLEQYKEEDHYEPTESWLQKRDRIRHEKRQKAAEMAGDKFKGYNPEEDPKVKGDPFRTLFVGRLSYDVKESDLEREFGRFGPIERIRIVRDEHAEKPKKPSRGYAFVVFEREKDLKAAYKDAEAPRIKDRRCVVDVERGRSVPGWRPRRFGGGLGGRGYTKQAPAKPVFGAGPGGYGGEFRGGFRGDLRGGRGGGFRGGFRGDRGGFGGDRGGHGGDRGGYGGRGGIGYQGGSGGFGGRPPANAPSGPGGRGGSGGGGYDDRRNGYSGGGGYGGGRDRGGDRGGSGGGRERYDDRDRYGGGRRDDDYGSRKRQHDGDQYDDPRSKRRY
ncbi:hypothetical protein LTS08_003834 [Lithohypha guttulata]|uniref:uncharacterized protein n=1 Tax=Lithohypha guttulata TaxID=1690604 RepID=UPI002DDEC120|nr:hypothetical protein LTR51_001212 [Lithohypha guttulata]KAK5103031.1 hypothetical protein LTS08_003834 [Lithohypha guttulata]